MRKLPSFSCAFSSFEFSANGFVGFARFGKKLSALFWGARPSRVNEFLGPALSFKR